MRGKLPFAAAGTLRQMSQSEPPISESVERPSRAGVGQVGHARPFGNALDGTPVHLYTLRNAAGAVVTICTYGGIVTSLKVPDRHGIAADVVLGFDDLRGYITCSPYFGAIIGRCANRITRGCFTLEGIARTLATNNGINTLHGGITGFDKVVWAVASAGPDRITLTYISVDGDEGFPGTLSVQAEYELTADNSLKLTFTATTDKPTVVNLTSHSYFNLGSRDDILNHRVYINADAFTPVDATLIPTGQLRDVAGTAFDFREPMEIGARISSDDAQLAFGRGYDHNWVIDKPSGQLGLMARISEPTSGRVLEVFSTQPGLQFYSGNFLDGTLTGKAGRIYAHRGGFCMEPQHFPDSPNQPHFPSVVLKPGQTYHARMEYRFSTDTAKG